MLLWTDAEQKQWELTREWALRGWGSDIPAPPPGQEVLSWGKETGAGSSGQGHLCAWKLRAALQAPAVLGAGTVGIVCRAETRGGAGPWRWPKEMKCVVPETRHPWPLDHAILIGF